MLTHEQCFWETRRDLRSLESSSWCTLFFDDGLFFLVHPRKWVERKQLLEQPFEHPMMFPDQRERKREEREREKMKRKESIHFLSVSEDSSTPSAPEKLLRHLFSSSLVLHQLNSLKMKREWVCFLCPTFVQTNNRKTDRMIKKQTYRMSQEAQETKVQGIQSQIHSKRETRQETSEVSLSLFLPFIKVICMEAKIEKERNYTFGKRSSGIQLKDLALPNFCHVSDACLDFYYIFCSTREKRKSDGDTMCPEGGSDASGDISKRRIKNPACISLCHTAS